MFRTNSRVGVKKVNSGKKLITHPRQQQVANVNMGGDFTGGSSGLSVSAIGASQRENKDLFLTGIVNDKQKRTLNLFLEDIYTYDPYCGSAVDLTSTLPFSDFSLRGAKEEQLDVHMSSIERLDLKNRNPTISANMLVFGEYVSTLVYSSKQKIFTDMLEYDHTQTEMQYLPFSSMEPVITVRPDAEFKEFINSSEEHIEKLRKHIPQSMLDSMSSGEFVLDPLTTLYLARTPINRRKPVSYLQRVIPVYLIEKSLLRGTLTEAAKRQRAFFHAACGDENWEPTAEELNAIAGMIQKTELDPMGAVVTTRKGIDMQEVRQGGDFWKYTDIVDITGSLKMKALGISESFLTAESNFATAEVGLTVFMENLKAFRQNYTQHVFYNKIFPTISAVNGFYDEDVKQNQGKSAHHKVNDPSKLIIPEVHWHKALEPLNDEKTMETLTALEEKGMPVTLRAWAAAGGMDVEDFTEDLNQDLVYRKKFAEYAQKLQEIGGESEDTEEFASMMAKHHIKKKPNVMARQFPEESHEHYELTPTGKKKYVHNQKKATAKYNSVIRGAMRRLNDESHYKNVANSKYVQQRITPNGF